MFKEKKNVARVEQENYITFGLPLLSSDLQLQHFTSIYKSKNSSVKMKAKPCPKIVMKTLLSKRENKQGTTCAISKCRTF